MSKFLLFSSIGISIFLLPSLRFLLMKDKCREEFNCDDILWWGIFIFMPFILYYAIQTAQSMRMKRNREMIENVF